MGLRPGLGIRIAVTVMHVVFALFLCASVLLGACVSWNIRSFFFLPTSFHFVALVCNLFIHMHPCVLLCFRMFLPYIPSFLCYMLWYRCFLYQKNTNAYTKPAHNLLSATPVVMIDKLISFYSLDCLYRIRDCSCITPFGLDILCRSIVAST